MDIKRRRKGQTIHSEARTIIAKVIDACDEEKQLKQPMVDVKKATERAAYFTGVSTNTIISIRKEYKESPNSTLSTPGKHRPRPVDDTIASIDSFDRMVIRNTINDFYIRLKIVPSTKKLLPVLREKIDFKWGAESLRKVLLEMGFRWRKTRSQRSVLIERQEIINWRYKYLTKLRQLRAENRTIYYLDETWVDSNLTFKKCWQGKDVKGIIAPQSSSHRLIVSGIGSVDGFLPDSTLIFKAGQTTGDYHGQMNSENFEKWMVEKVIKKVKPGSVIVMDNAPYHGVQIDKPPTKSSTKVTMLEWLKRKSLECHASMRKSELWDIITRHLPKEKQFRVDKLLQENGHIVVRTPPYMCELNPIELAWAQVKHYIRNKNVGDLNNSVLFDLTNEAINSVTAKDWRNYIEHVHKIENEYWEKDGIMETLTDDIIINLGENVDSTDDEQDNSTDEEDSGSELAVPL